VPEGIPIPFIPLAGPEVPVGWPMPLPTSDLLVRGPGTVVPIGGEPNELAEMRSYLESFRARMASLSSNLASHEEIYQRDLSAERGARSQAEAIAESLNEELSAERGARAKIEAREQEVEVELQRQRELHDKDEVALRQVQTSLDEALHRSGSLETDLGATGAERDELRRGLASAQAKVEELTDGLARAAELLRKVRDRLHESDEETTTLRQQLAAERARSDDLEQQVISASRSADQARHFVTELAQHRSTESADDARVHQELERARARVAALEQEVAALRLAPVPPAAAPSPPHVPVAPPAPVPCVPVGFVGPDGRTPVKEAYYALGKGEALEELLDSLIHQWGSGHYPLIPLGSQSGAFVLGLQGDPDRRSIRILHTGAILIRMSSSELQALGKLPTLVSHRSVGSRVNAFSLSAPAVPAEGEPTVPRIDVTHRLPAEN
jgi:hypothetical protein